MSTDELQLPPTANRITGFMIDYGDEIRPNVYFRLDINNLKRLALSKDGGRTYQGLLRIATGEECKYLSGTTNDYFQYARPDGTFEAIVIVREPGLTYVTFNGQRAKVLDGEYAPMDDLVWPDANTRAIEQCMYAEIDGTRHYYVLTSRLKDWGMHQRGVNLFYGADQDLYQIPIWETKKSNSFGGYTVVTHQGELRVLRPQYNRLIPGGDETTSFMRGHSPQTSTWVVSGEPTRQLVNDWDYRHQRFEHSVHDGTETIRFREQ